MRPIILGVVHRWASGAPGHLNLCVRDGVEGAWGAATGSDSPEASALIFGSRKTSNSFAMIIKCVCVGVFESVRLRRCSEASVDVQDICVI
jgi:hypothetical protein